MTETIDPTKPRVLRQHPQADANGSPTRTGGLAFANPDRLVRSWYVVCPSREIRTNKVIGVEMLGRRLAVWRDTAGEAHVLNSVCPHLGADLSQGEVIDGAVQCPFHHWRFAGDGRCIDAPCESTLPHRRAETFATEERHGLLWMYNGEVPAFALPDFAKGETAKDYRRVLVPSLHLNCHPHLAIANGFDATHLDKLHGLNLSEEPTLEAPDDFRLELSIRGRPRSRWVQTVTRTRNSDVEATFGSIGCSIAWLTFDKPIRFHVIFTARPDAAGQTDTQTVIYLPRGFGWRAGRAAVTLLMLLHADRAVLNAIRFHRGFTESDYAQRRFAELVDTMEREL